MTYISATRPQRQPADAPKKRKTRDRIIDAAIKLFNEQGVESVASYKIASEIGISPGNLTYYFPGKKDLVLDALSRFESEFIKIVSNYGDATDVQNIFELLDNLFRLLWRYRFIFVSMNAIVNISDELEDYIRNFEADIHRINSETLANVIASGLMRPVRRPNTVDFIADNLWSVWFHSMRAFGLGRLKGKDAENAAVYYCAVHHISLLEPYFSSAFSSQLYSKFEPFRPSKKS